MLLWKCDDQYIHGLDTETGSVIHTFPYGQKMNMWDQSRWPYRKEWTRKDAQAVVDFMNESSTRIYDIGLCERIAR
jgi:hypothetical protein